MTPLATITIKVYDIKGLGLPRVGWRKKPGKYYLKVAIDGVNGTEKQTKISARRNAVSWTEVLYFDTHRLSTLDFHIYAQHNFGRDDLIGSARGSIDSLLVEGASGAITRELYIYSANGKSTKTESTVEFCIALAPNATDAFQAEMNDVVPGATAAFEQMRVAPLLLEDTQNEIDTWDALLTKINLFTQIVYKISEVHPYAKMAWSILSATHKIVLGQKERDDAISHLLRVMTDVYVFVLEAGPTKIFESHGRILAVMVKQTTECSYFIREYAINKSFSKRILKHIFSDADSKITQYENKFKELQTAFQTRAVLQTEITVLRILDVVESLGEHLGWGSDPPSPPLILTERTAENIDLRDMPYAAGARFNPDKRCLPGTREQAIDEITEWINSPNSDEISRVYFLSGVAGFGKSAIAHTIALQFDQLGRLGSSFCFDRADQAQRRPDNIFSTIALDIADLDPQWKTSLRNVVHGKRALRSTLAAGEQFTNFILKPSEALTTVGPIVIVIDALDECGDRASREVLLSIIAERMCDLPANFRVLITSRPESDIYEALRGKKHVFCKSIDTLDAKANEADISLYIRTQLSDVPGLDSQWPSQQWCRLLLDSSNGLFQWASTACSAIKGGKGALRPTERLTRFITSAHGLDGLYTEILDQAFDSNDSEDMFRFTLIMGRILAAKEPLSVASLSELRADGEQADLVQLVLQPLASLLSGVTRVDVAVRLLHASLNDFLTCKKRSTCFFVDLSLQDRNLAWACWRVMMTSLRFNICELETSHVKNADVMDLATRVTKHIPSHLSYACRFWGDHARAMSFELATLEIVRSLLVDHFFEWLEVLSLLGELLSASSALLSSAEWIKDHDKELADFATDANSFVTTFRYPMSQSTPHIYISALPFAPTRSLISRQFLSKYPHLLSVDVGKMTEWPVAEHTFEGHTDCVTSVAYSPDGKRIVSGSWDRTVRLWDAETGEAVAASSEGHTDAVVCVAYSPDGQWIASGSEDQTVRVWDAKAGKEVLEPFKGHTGGVTSIAYSPDSKRVVSGSTDQTVRVWDAEIGVMVAGPFNGHTRLVQAVAYSPDGKRIVSGSEDRTVRVWDAETGEATAGPFKGHTHGVMSIACSPDGKWIVSGSMDQTVRVWDAQTGQSVAGPFEGHTNIVTSVAYSFDSKRIVSGSTDQTVRVWDAQTGQVVAGPFDGHTNAVWSVAYSPDSKQIVSGSMDQTVRVWDVQTSQMVAGPFEGHTNTVMSVTYSPDGKHIASGSDDQTVRVWDAYSGKPAAKPFEGHTNAVSSVAYSPDSKRIVSGSWDQTVRVWDAQTGQMVAGPFEGHTDCVLSVGYSPDGKQIVSGSWDETVRVWDAETGEVVAGPLIGHTNGVWSVAYSPDGMRIVSGSDDNTVCVWDAETGKMITGPLRGHTSAVRSVAYSPDGKRIVSGSWDGTIRVWGTETGVVAWLFRGHTHRVEAVTYSPDGKRIVSGSEDHVVRVWDAETGDVAMEPFKGHTNTVTCIAHSPDGKRIVSGSHDRTLRVWNTVTSEAEPCPTSDHTTSNTTVARKNAIDTSNLRNGWVLVNGSQSELLFWIPPHNRIGLWAPRNTAVIGRRATRLGFRKFLHGKEWDRCRSEASEGQ